MRNVWQHLNTVYVKHGSLDLSYFQYHDLKDGCVFHEKLASTSVFAYAICSYLYVYDYVGISIYLILCKHILLIKMTLC